MGQVDSTCPRPVTNFLANFPSFSYFFLHDCPKSWFTGKLNSQKWGVKGKKVTLKE